MAKRHLEVIRAAIEQRKNILVAGSTGSGKTTFINAVLDELAWHFTERPCPHHRRYARIAMQRKELGGAARGRACVDARLPAGLHAVEADKDCRGRSAGRGSVEHAQSVEHRAPGGAASVHANDAHGALIRLESLVAEATAAPQQQLIAEAVNVVVFVDGEPSIRAGRKVREVAVVMGYRDGDYKLEYV